MIGLIGAMKVELEMLLHEMENPVIEEEGMDRFACGKLYGQDTVMCVCGPGKVNAALSTQHMILRYHPDWILNLGVAGSGEVGVNIGDMVIASAAVQHDMDTTAIGDPLGFVSKIGLVEIPCDAALHERLVAAAEAIDGLHVVEGLVATGDQFIHSGEVRERIHNRFPCKCVEMEGAAVAHACYMHHVPCGIVRSISDGANGQSEMDYPTFANLAAIHAQQVVEKLLRGM